MAERSTGFSIIIRGTEEQQKKLALLTGQLGRVSQQRLKDNKAAKDAGFTNQRLNDVLSRSTLRQKELRARLTATTRAIQNQGQAQKKTGGLFTSINRAVTNSFKQVGAAIGIAFGARALLSVIGGAINIFKDFQKAQADLASVLGKSRSEIQALTEDAKRLGSQTVFTASQVSELQKEFAKLGFSEQQILDATEATLQLAAATNSDLAQAAEVAGATVRGFGLDASETQRVVDVMAKSFSLTALDIGRFQVAMANVAPVAKVAGLSIEETTGFLGLLVNRGIDASKAGTDLRNIFLELSKQGLTLEEAMNKIQTSTDKNKTALELFGKRASVSAVIMAENSEEADTFTEALNNAGGAAEKMAEEQLDTLSGDLKLLTSAWEGFILDVESGEGIIAKATRAFVSMGTGILNTLSNLDEFVAGFNDGRNAIEKLLDSGDIRRIQKELTAIQKNLAFEGLSRDTRKNLIEREVLFKARLAELGVLADSSQQAREKQARESQAEDNKDSIDLEKELTEAQKKELEKRAKERKKLLEQAEKDLLSFQDDLRKQQADAALAAIDDETDRRVAAILKRQEEEEILAFERIERLEEIEALTNESQLEAIQNQFDLLAEQELNNQDEINRIRQDARDKDTEAAEKKADEDQKLRNKELTENLQFLTSLTTGLGDILAESIKSGDDAGKAAVKLLLTLTLETLEKLALIDIAKATTKQIAEKGFIGIGTAAVLVGLIKAAVSTAKAAIGGFAGGGKIDGVYDRKDNIPIMVSGNETVLNPMQRARLGGDAAMRAAGVPGYQAGGRADVLPSQGTLPALPSIARGSAGIGASIDDVIDIVLGAINTLKVEVVESEIREAAKRVEVIEAD